MPKVTRKQPSQRKTTIPKLKPHSSSWTQRQTEWLNSAYSNLLWTLLFVMCFEKTYDAMSCTGSGISQLTIRKNWRRISRSIYRPVLEEKNQKPGYQTEVIMDYWKKGEKNSQWRSVNEGRTTGMPTPMKKFKNCTENQTTTSHSDLFKIIFLSGWKTVNHFARAYRPCCSQLKYLCNFVAWHFFDAAL